MRYVGLDLASKEFVACAIDQRERVKFESTIAPTPAGLKELVKKAGPGKLLIAFEAGNQMKWVADTLQRMTDVEVHVVHPNTLRWIYESSGKTDRIDARKMAKLARSGMLPRKVHVVEGVARQLRELTSARKQLMQKRVALECTLRGYLKQEGVQLAEKYFGQADWQAQLAKKKVSATLLEIVKAFRPSIEALHAAEAALVVQLKTTKDKRTELLETIPGIGVLTSRTLVGAFDEVKRFDSGKSVAKYTALAPIVKQSGDEVHLGRVNFDGRREARRVLLQCAHQLVRMKGPAAEPLVAFFRGIERRRGKKRALVALSRKLAVVAYGVLKSKKPYDPEKLRGRHRAAPEGDQQQTKKASPATKVYVLRPVK